MQPAFNSLLSILLLSISIHVTGQDHRGLKFVENKGKWNEEVDFQAIVPGGRLGVSAAGFHVQPMDMDFLSWIHIIFVAILGLLNCDRLVLETVAGERS